MDVPVSEFMKIAQESKNKEMIKNRVGQAIKALFDCASDNGKLLDLRSFRRMGALLT